MSSVADPDQLQPSELGTQEYWDDCYKDEVKNFQNCGNVGDVWFGENVVNKIISWIINKSSVKKTHSIVDLGCGNGLLLIELYKKGYSNLLGLDYSKNAIVLAEAISKKYNYNIAFEQKDILKESPDLKNIYDVVLDKGTYDAISLSENAKEKQTVYVNFVDRILKENGLFIIASCNWTLEELNNQFKNNFNCYESIPTSQFQFGGKVGNVVTCVVYKKIVC